MDIDNHRFAVVFITRLLLSHTRAHDLKLGIATARTIDNNVRLLVDIQFVPCRIESADRMAVSGGLVGRELVAQVAVVKLFWN